MKNDNDHRRAAALKATIKQCENELNIGAKILEWEIGILPDTVLNTVEELHRSIHD